MARKLNIAVVSPFFAPNFGGLETHVGHVTAGLAARGHDVTVYTQATKDLIAEHGSCETLNGVRVKRHPLPIATIGDIPSPALIGSLRRSLPDADVVHAHGYHALPALAAAYQQGPAPLVVTPHYHGTGHTPMRARLHHLYKPAGRRLLTRSAAVIAVSEAERDLLVQDFGQRLAERTHVIPNGVRAMTGAVPFKSDCPVVLAVGRLEPYKRVDILIRAVAELPTAAKLVICGDGPARQELAELITRLDVADRVTLLGRVSDDELSRWWATASVYATASTHEAFGITLAEALSAGIPSVASDLPSHREIANAATGASLVPGHLSSGPGAAWAEQPVIASFTQALQSKLAEHRGGDVTTSLWTWDGVVDATEALYSQLSRRAGV